MYVHGSFIMDSSSSKQNQEEIELHTVPTMMIMIVTIIIIVIDCIRMVAVKINPKSGLQYSLEKKTLVNLNLILILIYGISYQ